MLEHDLERESNLELHSNSGEKKKEKQLFFFMSPFWIETTHKKTSFLLFEPVAFIWLIMQVVGLRKQGMHPWTGESLARSQ